MTLIFNDSKINFTNFELSNHLGNVLATVTDYKIGIDSIYTYSPGNSGTRMYKDYTDYYLFSMMIPWRYDDGDNGNFNTSLDIPMSLTLGSNTKASCFGNLDRFYSHIKSIYRENSEGGKLQ